MMIARLEAMENIRIANKNACRNDCPECVWDESDPDIVAWYIAMIDRYTASYHFHFGKVGSD